MTKPNLNLLNEMAQDIFKMGETEKDAYNAILYKAFEAAEFAKGCGGDVPTKDIRQWCNNLNRSHGLPEALIEDIILEIESRIG